MKACKNYHETNYKQNFLNLLKVLIQFNMNEGQIAYI